MAELRLTVCASLGMLADGGSFEEDSAIF